jgi:hypothetical protein
VPQDQQDDRVLAQLVNEYKILQDKLDKIGAFRFTIKGWSITLVFGVIFAGATKSVPPFIWAICLILFLAAFYFFEREQVKWGQIFGDRVLKIERVISSRLRTVDKKITSEFIMLQFIPGIGHDLKRRPRTHKLLLKKLENPAKQEIEDFQEIKRSLKQRVFRHMGHADSWFYYSQALLVFALACLFSFFPVDSSRNPSIVNFMPRPQNTEEFENEISPSRQKNGSSTTAIPVATPESQAQKPEPSLHGKKKTN